MRPSHGRVACEQGAFVYAHEDGSYYFYQLCLPGTPLTMAVIVTDNVRAPAEQANAACPLAFLHARMPACRVRALRVHARATWHTSCRCVPSTGP